MAVPVERAPDGNGFAHHTPTMVVSGQGYYKRVPPQLGRTYDVSRDGRRFVRIKARQDGSASNAGPPDEFVVVGNWFEELKRLVPTE